MQDVQQKVKPFLVSANMAHFAYDNMMKVLDTINRYVHHVFISHIVYIVILPNGMSIYNMHAYKFQLYPLSFKLFWTYIYIIIIRQKLQRY